MDERDQRIVELEERVEVLEQWAQKTSIWMSALAQQDAWITLLLPFPKAGSDEFDQFKSLLGRVQANYKALDAFANGKENTDEQSD